MELAPEVIGGLQLAGDSARIPSSCFEKLLNYVVEGLLIKERVDNIKGDLDLNKVDQGVLKQAYFGLITLFVEATRTAADDTALQSVLEDCKFSAERSTQLCKVLTENRFKVSNHLQRVTFQLPHIVDVNWRLDYCIKTNHLDKVNRATYLISLTTQGGRIPTSQEHTFACTVEQLQDLVSKLKDAVKCWERKSEEAPSI